LQIEPERAIGDGALGFWKALARILHERGRRFRAEARCYWCSNQTTTGIADAKLYQ
jgi:hypothetical protein